MSKALNKRVSVRESYVVFKSIWCKPMSLYGDRKPVEGHACETAPRSILTYVSNFLKLAVMVIGATFMSSKAFAQTVIYQDDFESGAAGWSNNTTENAPMIGTNFLGRFGGPTPQVSRTFTVPAGATALEIEFDLLRFDSWDFFGPGNDDGFSVLIDGTPLFSTTANFGTFPYLDFPGGQGARSGTTGNVDWDHVPINPAAGSAPANLDFRNFGSFDFDQIHRFTITVNNPGATVDLTLLIDSDQDISDESAGYDNFLVTAIAPTPSIDAVDNDFTATPLLAGATTPSVFGNDDFNGAVPTAATVDVSLTNDGGLTGATINADGTIDVPAGAAAGTYTLTYEICEAGSTTNCDTATVIVEVDAPATPLFTPIPPLVPDTCGAVLAEAYFLDGMGIGAEQNYRLASGSTTHDPDAFFGPSGAELGYIKNADGSISYFFDGEAPVETNIGTISSIPTRNLASVGGNAADQTDGAEFWRITARIDGLPGETVNFTLNNGNAHEFIHYWAEDSSGNVIDSSLGDPNTANGWYYGTGANASTSSASGATSIQAQITTPVSYTIPASNTDGIVYLNLLVLDPQAGFGRPTLVGAADCPEPSIELIKSVSNVDDTNGNGLFGDAGDTVNYALSVENTGDRALANISVADAGLQALTGTATLTPNTAFDGDLAVNEGPIVAANATYVLTATDVAAGNVTNIADVTSDVAATDASGNPDLSRVLIDADPVLDDSDTGTDPALDFAAGSVPVVANPANTDTGDDPTVVNLPTVAPALTLVKSNPVNADEDGDGAVSFGDTLTYTITATNSGNIDQNNVVVSDNLITPNSNTCAVVPIGGTCVLTGDYTVTLADAGGDIVNTASVTSDEVTTPVTDAVTTPVVQTVPMLTLVKSAPVNADEDGDGAVSIGDTLTYTITATNTGNVDQTNVVVTDNRITPSSNSCAVVPVGGTCTLTGDYTVTMADAGGDIVNTASVTSAEVPTPVTDSVTTPVVVAAPALTLVKSNPVNADEDGDGSVSIGDTLTYTITTTNSGNIDQTNVVLTDNLIAPSTNTCATVAVGATCTLTGDYIVTMADEGTDLVNTASVVSDEVTTPVTDEVTTPVVAAAPALTLVKSNPVNADEDGDGTVSIGDTLTYTITATNSGNIDQTNVVVTDNLIAPSTNTCASVAVGATCTLTGTYTVTMADEGSDILNTASVVSDEVTTPVTDEVTTPVAAAAPALTLVKSNPVNADEDGDGAVSIGDTLTYTIVATNSGNIDQTNVVLTDNLITPSTNTCATVAVGATCTLTGTYTVTMTDEGTDLVNTASVVSDEVTTPVTDEVTTPVVAAAPALTLVKSNPVNADEDGDGAISIGDTLTYTITATNTGNIDQTNVVLTDNLIAPSTITCATVAVGGTCTLTGDYSVTMADAAAGTVDNVASVISDEVTTAVADDVSVPVVPGIPALTLVKSAPINADEDGSGAVSIGDTLTYTITATNAGNVDQTNVTVTDNLIAPSTNICAVVPVGATCVLTGDYTVTMADESTDIVNTASVVSDEVTTPVTDTVTTPVDPAAPALTLVKSNPVNADEDGDGSVSIGDTLTYTIVATNSGNIDQNNVVLTDNLIAPSTTTCATVAVGGTCTLTGDYTVTMADEATDIVNTASVVSDEVPTPVTDTVATAVVAADPMLTLVKSAPVNADEDADGSVSIGDTLTYTIVATNSGNIDQTNVVVTDNLIAPNTNTCAALAVGATCTLTGDYTVTMADEGGDIVNTASVVSDDVTTPVTDTVVTPAVPAAPALTLVKSNPVNADEDGDGAVSIGDTLTYTIVATNSGNIDQTNVVLTDNLVAPSTNICATVAVGGTCTLTGDYTVTMADEGGDIVNTASVVSDEVTTPVTDEVTTPVVPAAPALTLVKSNPVNADEDGDGSVSIGDTLTYTITATNSGNIDQTNVVVTDNLIAPSTNTCATVAVGGTCTLTGNYTVTMADEGGDIVNTASVVSDEVTTPVSDEVTTPVVAAAPALTLVKSDPVNADEDGDGSVSIGDTLTYTIVATNSGNIDQNNVVLTDNLIAPSTTTCATVAVGGTCTLTGDYTVTMADEGTDIVNTASVVSDEVTTPVTDEVTTPVVSATPALTLVKSDPVLVTDLDGSTTISIGDTLSYTIVATNSGNIDQTNVVVTDNLISPSSNTCAALAVGATCALTGEYTVTMDDAGGDIVNTASVVSDEVPTPVTDTVTTPVVPSAPALTLVKSAPVNADEDGSGAVSVGDTLIYTITATNSGNVDQTNVTITDTLIAPSTNVCATVTVGGTCVLTGDYTVTAEDVNASVINNTAEVVSDEVTVPVSDSVSTPVVINPITATNDTVTAAAGDNNVLNLFGGDTVNGASAGPSNVALNVDPASVPAELSFDPATGAVGVAANAPAGTYSFEYEICEIANPTNCTTAIATVTVDPVPSLELVKSEPLNKDEDESDTVTVGDTLTYVITATNTGNAPQTNMVVTDNKITPSSNTCSTVEIGGICELIGTYAVTAADVNSGADIVNTASVVSNEVTTPVTDTVSTPTTITPILASNDTSDLVKVGEPQALNLFDGDTVNGVPAGPSNVTLTADPANIPSALTFDPVTGLVGVTATAQAGTYSFEYQICEVANPSNCTTAVATVTVGAAPSLGLVKSEPVLTTDADGSTTVSLDDVLTYTITATNTGNAPQNNVVVSDPLITPSTTTCALVATNETCVLTGTYTVTAADVTAGTIDNTASTVSDEVTTPVTDTVSTPVELFSRTPLNIMKSALNTNVQIGDLVPYTITVTNTEDFPRVDLDIVDLPPHGFSFVEETSLLNGEALEPSQTGGELVLNDIDFAPNETKTWTLVLAVGAGVNDGLHTNNAFVRDALNTEVTERAQAVVQLSVDPLFDCSELIGKVFDDKNNNGHQDENEPGLAGVRLATATGLLVTTDQHGRYHITCASVPNSLIGSNFILKLDHRTLPTGYEITTENPRVVRLTRGKLTKLNFGAALRHVITLDVTDAAFVQNTTEFKTKFTSQLDGLVEALKQQETTLKVRYHSQSSDVDVDKRMKRLARLVQDMWKNQGGDYDLNIERETVQIRESSGFATVAGE